MSRSTRKALITKLQQSRKSKVITYITSTRQNAAYEMQQMDIRLFYDHLKAISKAPRIDLFLHSYGGDVTLPWRLVNLIREYTNEFNVLIPLNAFSAATLISLGADNIIMLPAASLGPTDPSTSTVFNKLPVSVEDLASYIKFVKEDFEIKSEQGLVEALRILSNSDSRIHPLTLGTSKRSFKLAKKYAKELLKSHLRKKIKTDRIDKIVRTFSSELYSHNHPINRKEANDHGLNIQYESESTEKLIWDLFLEYEKDFKMDTSFDVTSEFKLIHPALPLTTVNSLSPVATSLPPLNLAMIESLHHNDIMSQEYDVTGIKFIDASGIQEKYSWIAKNLKWTKDLT